MRKGIQDLKTRSYTGGYNNEDIISGARADLCPEGTALSIRNDMAIIPAYSKVLVEFAASFPESVRAILVVEDAATKNTSGVVLDRADLRAEDPQQALPLLPHERAPLACSSARCSQRCWRLTNKGAHKLRSILCFFIMSASTLACDVLEVENSCLEQAIAAAMAAARVMAEEHGEVAL